MIRRLASLFACAAALGLLFAATGGASSARAGVNDFSFESFHADYTLDRDAGGHSTLHTVETLVALFPDFDQNRGIIRAIPTKDLVRNTDYLVQVAAVRDENGAPVPFTTQQETGYDFLDVIIGTDAYVHGRTTYVIDYTEKYAATNYPDTHDDEFYWDVNGDGWAQSFGTVSADIHLGAGLTAALNGGASCYRGYSGDTTQCSVTRTSDGYRLTTSDVGAYQTATVAIGFRAGTFVPGPTPRDSWVVTVLPWVLLAVLLGLGILLAVVRIFVWRDSPGTGIIVPRYEAPDGIGVMESAELLHRGGAGFPAALVNLTVLGAATLVEDPDAPADARYRLELHDASRITEPDDERVLDKLFTGTATTVVLDRGDEKLGDRIHTLQAEVSAQLRARKYLVGRRSPITVVARLLAFFTLVGSVVVFFWSASNDAGSGLLTLQLILGVAGSLVVVGFAGVPERLSAKGAAVREQLLGLRDYLQLAEADRLRYLQSPTGAERTRIDPTDDDAIVKLYEKLLPWAMVWGIEAQWATVLGTHYATTPVATSNVQFAGSTFLTHLSSFSYSMQANSFARTPPPPSSSGSSWSGSGGGGFSGGSFGGGFSGGGGGGGGGGGR